MREAIEKEIDVERSAGKQKSRVQTRSQKKQKGKETADDYRQVGRQIEQ